MNPIRLITSLSLLCLPLSGAYAAPLWTVDTGSSHLRFAGKDSGKDFSGEFKIFTPEIAFDAKDLATSSIKVTIDTGSASTGDKTYDGSLPTSEWFNIAKFPDAVFQSKSITAIDATHFEMTGTLTMVGISKDITLPFVLESDGKTARATGETTLKRLDFGLGKSVDSKGDTVSNDIIVKFDITAHQ